MGDKHSKRNPLKTQVPPLPFVFQKLIILVLPFMILLILKLRIKMLEFWEVYHFH